MATVSTTNVNNEIRINDYIKIDAKDNGRVVSNVKPTGINKLFNIQTQSSEMWPVPRYRLLNIP